MQVEISQVAAHSFGKFRHRANAFAVFAILTLPNRERRAPVTLARERPVNIIFEPVAEAAFLDVVGRPVDGTV